MISIGVRTAFAAALLGAAGGCIAERAPAPAVESMQTSASGELNAQDVTRAYNQIELLRLDPSDASERELIALASHPDFLLRIRAVRALGDPGYSRRAEAENVLLRALDDPHWIVRATAVKAVSRSDVSYACPELVRRRDVEENQKVKALIDSALERLRSQSRC